MATVRNVARGLMDGRLSVDQAVEQLRGVEPTTTVGRMSDEDQILGVDPPVGDDNDIIHLDLALAVGAISPAEYARLVRAAVPRRVYVAFGPDTTDEEVERLADLLWDALQEQRRRSQ